MIGLFADNHAFNQGLINYLTERTTVLTAIGENTFCPEIGDGDVEGGIPFDYFGRLVCHLFDRREGEVQTQKEGGGIYTFVASGSQCIDRLAHRPRNRRLRLDDAVIEYNTKSQLTICRWDRELLSPGDGNHVWIYIPWAGRKETLHKVLCRSERCGHWTGNRWDKVVLV